MGTSPIALSAAPVPPGPSAIVGREALLAGLDFLEGSTSPAWDVRGLRDWFDRHLVATGCMLSPVLVNEPSAGTVALYSSGAQALASQSSLPRVLTAARIRVLSALRGLIASPVDDRFLAAAIFAGRVRRRRVGERSQWVARPESTAPLSGIVLSLFAVDILSHRDVYDRGLCVCDVCNRVTFQDAAFRRRACPEHQAHVSGFTRAVRPKGE
jgi:hypothetical protein